VSKPASPKIWVKTNAVTPSVANREKITVAIR
jgi:hypothetical protein